VVREIWVFYFQNLISPVLEQLHVIKWPLLVLLIGLYQCWVLDCVRIEVLLVIWCRKVGLERGKHCDDRWEFQRSYFYFGRYTNDASMYEEAVVSLLFCIALVVREIWAFYFQNLISPVLEQLHVIKWPLLVLLIGLYQCWVLDCVRIEVLLVIWGRKVGLERGKHCDDRWEFQRSYFYFGRYTNDASIYEEAVV
jgi:hypothetical protein